MCTTATFGSAAYRREPPCSSWCSSRASPVSWGRWPMARPSRDDLPLLMLVIGAIVLGLVLIIGLVALFQWLSYKHLYYIMGPEEFNLYSGIFNKKRVHVPYQRIQSVDQRASLLQRVFGVCTVSIDTAGGSNNKAVQVPYVQKSQAEAAAHRAVRAQAVRDGRAGGHGAPGGRRCRGGCERRGAAPGGCGRAGGGRGICRSGAPQCAGCAGWRYGRTCAACSAVRPSIPAR